MTKRPTPPFGGEIGRTIADSTPSWEDFVRPAEGAPNVVVIVLDDVGFAQLSCFGGSVATPAMDSLARDGVRFTNFHATTLCSPSRASLLTGRNHHAVGMGFLAGFDSGYPGYRGHVAPEAATVARMLQQEGYATFAVGKWHLVPPAHMSAAGPFENWPLGHGFDRYYGFLWGEDDQYSPQLWEDNHFIDPPRREGYHLSEDLADQARRMLGDHVSAGQRRPFFLYTAFGAAHAPHQAPQDYVDRFRGEFDHGWDVERERVLARQIELGLVVTGTTLPESNPGVVAWDSLPADERRLYARMQEVFAGFMAHTDDAVARLLGFLDEHGLTDNTVVILLSDNGASGEGGPHGSVNEYRYFMGLDDSLEENLARAEELGGPRTHNHYPSGWAQAGNTPLRLYKKYNYGGGVRTPLIIRDPRYGDRAGEIRDQFHHIIDIAPTILDRCHVKPHASYDDIEQMPIQGASMLATVAEPEAEGRRTQYFEMAGHRGLVHDRWKIVTEHRHGDDYDAEPWELYRLDDVTESHDLAAAEPDRVAELVRRWWQEAERNQVLPLDDRLQTRSFDRGPLARRREFRLHPGTRLFTAVAGPNWASRTFELRTRVARAVPEDGGVLLAFGRRAAGFSWFVADNRLVLDYNLAGEHDILVGDVELPLEAELGLDVVCLEPGRAIATLRLDEEAIGTQEIRTLLGGLGTMSTQVGHNSPSAVSNRYDAPFAFAGQMATVHVRFLDEEPAVDVAVELHHD